MYFRRLDGDDDQSNNHDTIVVLYSATSVYMGNLGSGLCAREDLSGRGIQLQYLAAVPSDCQYQTLRQRLKEEEKEEEEVAWGLSGVSRPLGPTPPLSKTPQASHRRHWVIIIMGRNVSSTKWFSSRDDSGRALHQRPLAKKGGGKLGDSTAPGTSE